MLQLLSKQRTVHVFFRISLLMLLVVLLSVGSIAAQESSLNCPPGTTPEDQIYKGIRRCAKGKTEVLVINPEDVIFETVLAQGYDRYNRQSDPNSELRECWDVNVPDFIIPEKSTGPGCYLDKKYPAEFVGEMAVRDPNTVAAFNADYFDHPGYKWGPQGLTVKNGDRFDGPCYGDYDGPEEQPKYLGKFGPSLAISKDGEVQIGTAEDEAPNGCKVENGKEVPYVTKPDKYWNTVGGGPILVKDSIVYDSDEDGNPDYLAGPDPFRQRGRTAVGKTAGGRLIVVVEPNPPDPDSAPPFGRTLQDLADLMIAFGAKDAINLDGGGSSQLWYNGDYLVPSSDSRRVPEALLVFSEKMPPPVPDPSSIWQAIIGFFTGSLDQLKSWWEDQWTEWSQQLEDWWKEQLATLKTWWEDQQAKLIARLEEELERQLQQLCCAPAAFLLLAAWVVHQRQRNSR